jgi:hypothetical protein
MRFASGDQAGESSPVHVFGTHVPRERSWRWVPSRRMRKMEVSTSSPMRVYANQWPFGDQSARNALTPGGSLVSCKSPPPLGRTVNKTAFPPTVRPKTIRPFSPVKVADANGATIRKATAAKMDAVNAERVLKDLRLLAAATMKFIVITPR